MWRGGSTRTPPRWTPAWAPIRADAAGGGWEWGGRFAAGVSGRGAFCGGLFHVPSPCTVFERLRGGGPACRWWGLLPAASCGATAWAHAPGRNCRRSSRPRGLSRSRGGPAARAAERSAGQTVAMGIWGTGCGNAVPGGPRPHGLVLTRCQLVHADGYLFAPFPHATMYTCVRLRRHWGRPCRPAGRVQATSSRPSRSSLRRRYRRGRPALAVTPAAQSSGPPASRLPHTRGGGRGRLSCHHRPHLPTSVRPAVSHSPPPPLFPPLHTPVRLIAEPPGVCPPRGPGPRPPPLPTAAPPLPCRRCG